MFRFGREAARSTFLVSRASLDAETAERSFRTKAWMRELARGMDSLTLPVMATVARENGKKVGGGRKLSAESNTSKHPGAATRVVVTKPR